MPTNPRHIFSRLVQLVQDMDVTLDPTLTRVDPMGTGGKDEKGYRIVAAVCDHSPYAREDEECLLLRSALHTLILDEFAKDGVVDVHVLLASSSTLHRIQPAHFPQAQTTTDWVQDQRRGIVDFLAQASLMLTNTACNRMLDSYPWVDAQAMRAKVPLLLDQAEGRLRAGKPVSTSCGNVDDLLPPVESFLPPHDVGVVLKEVARHLGQPPGTRLHLYETLYAMATVASPPLSVQSRYLLSQLFVMR